MKPSRRLWIWIVALVVIIILVLPMAIAERYTSPTQDGQYLGHPIHSFRFVVAAARGSTSSELNTSGEALALAKEVFADSDLQPTRVELLFLPDGEPYTYRTREGSVLSIAEPGTFVWEVWGRTTGSDADEDVIALIDYATGDVSARVE